MNYDIQEEEDKTMTRRYESMISLHCEEIAEEETTRTDRKSVVIEKKS